MLFNIHYFRKDFQLVYSNLVGLNIIEIFQLNIKI
jgi:hypothetical protein